ncbi:shikimate dehydrogenase [Paenibacillus turpanensis]|uniref:shikimate dehydrogenase n=1 Tax=Paenibacillus turpanensis TaxID=2689078 RepID=UPI00140CB101|nr:shikimate dehydrogenase [Paenibacillus turpanensis]
MGDMEQGKVPVNSETKVYGVYGDPIKQSKSPLMLNRAFAETGINAVYAAFHILPGRLEAAVAGIRGMGFGGVNVTIPYKVEVMQYLDEIDESARFAGAVNTIVNREGVLTGYNTDGIGYVRSLKEETGVQLQGKRILMIGAGGAARGVAYGLAKEGAGTIYIANRTADKASELAAILKPICEAQGMGMEGIVHIKDKVDLVMNTTSVGMHPNVDQMPVEPDWFRPGMIVSDLVYNPLETKLLREAKQRGAQTHGGLGMFVYQGAYAFEYWTGAAAPVEAMRDAVLRSLRGNN